MKHLIGLVKIMMALAGILLVYNLIVWIAASQILFKDIDNLVNDAVEMTMDDSYRADHISLLDPDALWGNFEYLVQKKYNLDVSFRAMTPGLIEKELVFTEVEIDPGEYTYDQDAEHLTIEREPSVHLAGYTEKRVEILSFQADVPIRFDVTVDNIRMD